MFESEKVVCIHAHIFGVSDVSIKIDYIIALRLYFIRVIRF